MLLLYYSKSFAVVWKYRKFVHTLEEKTLSDYSYNSTLGGCYKFHLNSASWYDAASLCEYEESYLAIIDSQAESDFFMDMTKLTEKEEITSGSIHLGFYKKDGNWVTVKSKLKLSMIS